MLTLITGSLGLQSIVTLSPARAIISVGSGVIYCSVKGKLALKICMQIP